MTLLSSMSSLSVQTSNNPHDRQLNIGLFNAILLQSDRTTARIIFQMGGVIYGSYLRDRVAKIRPSMMNCLIPQSMLEEFLTELYENGYVISYESDSDCEDKDGIEERDNDIEEDKKSTIWRAHHPANPFFEAERAVTEVTIVTSLEPFSYDVDALAFDGTYVKNLHNPQEGIRSIIFHIEEKKAQRIGDAPDLFYERNLKKLGYRIVLP